MGFCFFFDPTAQAVQEALREAHKTHKAEAPLPGFGTFLSDEALTFLLQLVLQDTNPDHTVRF